MILIQNSGVIEWSTHENKEFTVAIHMYRGDSWLLSISYFFLGNAVSLILLDVFLNKCSVFHCKGYLWFQNCRSVNSCESFYERFWLINTPCFHYGSLKWLLVTFFDCFIGRRMRDKLIQVERLHLAVEVSTKCGLDPAGVWAAWGMNCLINGDFPQAREKFNRCLKVSCVEFWCNTYLLM